jgi:thiol-disulfide isomerase/thioredoxin
MERAPVFRPLSLEEAVAAARAENRLLLVDVAAEWCEPCRAMERTAWRTAVVEAWVAEHAVAIQIDLDRDPAARELSVLAVPTVIAMRDGAEVDRITGARDARALLEWAAGVLEGRTELDRLRGVEKNDLSGRLELARAYLERGRDADAAGELMWLWDNALRVDPSWVGVRHSFLLQLMAVLAQRDAKARATFAAVRDAAAARLTDDFARRDWIALCSMLGEEAKVLEWFDRHRAGFPREVLADDVHLRDLLVRAGRWADLGALVLDPAAELREFVESSEPMLASAPRDLVERVKAMLTQELRTRAANALRAARAAGRQEAAQAVLEEAKRLDPSPAMAEALEQASA